MDAALVGGDDPQRLGVEQRAGSVAEVDQHAFHGSGFLFAVEGSGEGVAPGRADLHFFKPFGGGGRQGGGGEDDGCKVRAHCVLGNVVDSGRVYAPREESLHG